MESRKGISTFIATLLLMVLAVSAGVVIYAYTMGYLGGFGGTEQLGAMTVDEASATDAYNGTSGSGDDIVTAYIRNIGKTDINLDRVYIDGNLVAANLTDTVAEGGVQKVTFMCTNSTGGAGDDGGEAYGLQNGITYEVKVIADDNTQVSFSVKSQTP